MLRPHPHPKALFVGVSGRANDAVDAIGCRWFDRGTTAVHFERDGQMLRIAAMYHRVIPQPPYHCFGIRNGRLAKAK
jgi:hypothetical protein